MKIRSGKTRWMAAVTDIFCTFGVRMANLLLSTNNIVMETPNPKQKQYRFGTTDEPTDEMLEHLMESAAEKVRQSNATAERQFFDYLKRQCDEAKRRSRHTTQTNTHT